MELSCVPDPEGAEAWSTRRDLTRVWTQNNCVKAKFGPENTVILDSEAFKVRYHKENAIIVPEYTKDHVLSGGGES